MYFPEFNFDRQRSESPDETQNVCFMCLNAPCICGLEKAPTTLSYNPPQDGGSRLNKFTRLTHHPPLEALLTLYAVRNVTEITLAPGGACEIPTNFFVKEKIDQCLRLTELAPVYVLDGMQFKIRPGFLNPNYQGQLSVHVYNDSLCDLTIKANSHFCSIECIPYLKL